MTGHLIFDFAGTSISQVEREILAHPLVCGVILFTRNYESPEQIRSLVHDIRKIKPEAIISIDHEGGRVQRFREGFTVLPALGDVTEHYPKEKSQVLQALSDHAKTMATELINVGIDLSFTPVLDRNTGANEIIANRSFADDPEFIIELGRHYIAAMHEAGMPATGKHFPGHGSVTADSHLELPIDDRDLDTLRKTDLRPFVELAKDLDAIMAAHIIYPQVDKNPAGFSRVWLQTILRKELDFQGIIFSDCLTMRATATYGDYPDRAELALDAGCDIILVCNHPPGVEAILDSHEKYHNANSSQRILAFLQKLNGKRRS